MKLREFNIRCAKFLNISDTNSKYNFLFIYANTSFFADFDKTPDKDVWDYLLFDSDWNWLTDVVNEITTQGFRKYSYTHEDHSRCVFTDLAILHQNHDFGGGNIISDSGDCISEKDAIIKAINQFLIWYNDIDKYVPYKESLEFKELGFNEPCFGYYNNMGSFTLDLGKTNSNCNKMSMYNTYCAAPLYQDIIMWIYKKYGVWITIQPTSVVNKFQFRIYWNNDGLMNQYWNDSMKKEFNSPIEAYKAGINYYLNKLKIKNK